MLVLLRRLVPLALFAAAAWPQAIEFENGGLKYQTLTRRNITIMFTRMQTHVHEFSMWQVAVSNGSDAYWTIKPEDFAFQKVDGRQVNATPAQDVVTSILERGNHSDLVKLVTTYEGALYGIPNMKISNGYEQRRRNAMGEGGAARFRAAAAASAIVFVNTRLAPGQSTDGAIFIPSEGGRLSGGRIVVHTGGETFDFNPE